jgi:hypothetical protein
MGPVRPTAQDENGNLEVCGRQLRNHVLSGGGLLMSKDQAIRPPAVEGPEELLTRGETFGIDSAGAEKALDGPANGLFVVHDRHHPLGVAHGRNLQPPGGNLYWT